MMTKGTAFEHLLLLLFYLFVVLFVMLYVYEVEFLKCDHLSIFARFVKMREKQQIEASVIESPKENLG